MSAILVDTNNKKVLEETWISSIFKEYEAFPQIVSKKRQEEEMDYERDCQSYEGGRYVLTGQLTGGAYYRAYGQEKKNFLAKKVSIQCQNEGLVYVSQKRFVQFIT